MPNTPADAQAHPQTDHRHPDRKRQLEVRNDVLTPDLRKRAEVQGGDPEEKDPLTHDEDALRRDSLGGTSSLD